MAALLADARQNQILLIPTGLNLQNEAEFQFSEFPSSANPSGIIRDFIVEYSCMSCILN